MERVVLGDRRGTRDSLIHYPVNIVSSVIIQMNLHVYFLTQSVQLTIFLK